MPFVLDASVALAWCFEDETTSYTDGVLDRFAADVAVVPAIWPLEIANALLTAQRRQRIEPAEVARFERLLGGLPITLDAPDLTRALGAVLGLAREYRLSTYEAAYVELARREGWPLATVDGRLRAGAGRAGVAMLK